MQKVYDDRDYDYPKCGGHKIYLDHDKTYKVIQSSNHQGQYSNAERVLTLDDNYNMTMVIGHIDSGYTPVTIADVLVGNERGLAMQDWYNKHVKSDTSWMYDNAYKID